MEPRILRQTDVARSLLDPLRLRLLRHMEFPISAAALARRLHLPRQRVHYHVRQLERRGLVRVVEERRVGNCTERLVQAVATRFVLGAEVLGPLSGGTRAPAEGTVERRVTFPSREARAAFELELDVEIDRLAGLHGAGDDQGALRFDLVVGLHPAAGTRAGLPDPKARE